MRRPHLSDKKVVIGTGADFLDKIFMVSAPVAQLDRASAYGAEG